MVPNSDPEYILCKANNLSKFIYGICKHEVSFQRMWKTALELQNIRVKWGNQSGCLGF